MNDLANSLPDVATETLAITGTLDQVGMGGIEVPILLKDDRGQTYRVSARAEAFVSLDNPLARGIHMSRLFHQVQTRLPSAVLSFSILQQTVQSFLESHQDLSSRAFLAVEFSALVLRKALKSDNQGWRSYPVRMEVHAEKSITRYFLEGLVTYSSTCPASAALARQLVQQNFRESFTGENFSADNVHAWLGSEHGINATPHAQRSLAKVKVELDSKCALMPEPLEFSYLHLLDLLEDTLQTPVQTAVKRQDEQEFALRNGQNLMFCEDAARRVQAALKLRPELISYQGEFRHVESLHPHDAIARIQSGK